MEIFEVILVILENIIQVFDVSLRQEKVKILGQMTWKFRILPVYSCHRLCFTSKKSLQMIQL
ncbi:hypothetical protein, partial [Staphylococcus aureus]